VALLVLAAESAQPNALIAVLLVGLSIGVFGHIIHSRTLIITGILVIGLVSAYFSFVLQPSGK
jgi:F0F1-type ATP synthase assembly protein I